MNHHIVGRKHLIDAGEADALLSARCAGGEKPQSLIVNGEFPGERRVVCGTVCHKTGVAVRRCFLGSQQNLGRRTGSGQRQVYFCLDLRLRQEHLRMAVVHAVSDLLGREPEVHRTEHHAGLVARQIGEHKLRAVVELHHDNVTFPQSGTEQSVGETVRLCIQLGIVPDSAAFQICQRPSAAKPSHVPQKAIAPGIAVLKLSPERLHGTLFLIQNAGLSDLLQKLSDVLQPFPVRLFLAVFRCQHHLFHLPERRHLVLFHAVSSPVRLPAYAAFSLVSLRYMVLPPQNVKYAVP